MLRGARGQRCATRQQSLLSSFVQGPLQEKGSLSGNFFLTLMARSKSHQERTNLKLDEPKYLEWRERGQRENVNSRTADLEDWGAEAK